MTAMIALPDELTIDKLGRCVLPKATRERLGLHAGSRLRIAVNPDGTLTLTPIADDHLVERDGGLVWDGPLAAGCEPAGAVALDRDERARRAGGLG